jgi:two-component system cell cycle sensor histidine kinase/response regulator CckA
MEMITLNLLFLEGSPDDAELAVKELERKGFNVKGTRVNTKEGIREALEEMKIYWKSKQAEEALRESEEKYRTFYNSSRDAIMILNPDKVFLSGNPACVKMFGCRNEDEFISLNPATLSPEYQPDGALSVEKSQKMISIAMEQGSHFFEWKHKRVNGEEFYSTVLLARIKLYGQKILQATVREITEQKKLEAQLRQSQKMEAIGILAGGIAHDFNNILTTIIGNAELALMNDIKDESLRKEIKEIKKAGKKAAFLTRQLLAFSRKQIVKPKILNINELLTDIEKMLGRLIGENIELLTIQAPALWPVEIDPGQIEQLIINLAINARDAMLRGGSLTIETANADLDENYFRKRGIEGEKPGYYVMLAVSDTGSGMDKEIQEHIFEPFFTTKKVGQGTGLGLSTIYGIVKQNNGFIWVYSEPGKGTTFKAYLPKVKDMEPEEKEQTPAENPGGSETVLIVEDDDNLRKFAQRALQMYGYRILDAENGEDALRICAEYEGQIDLMITDVVMPKIGGREAAKRLKSLYPKIKVIYMSGYTNNAIVNYDVLESGLNFLEKPFTTQGLARKAREVLDE